MKNNDQTFLGQEKLGRLMGKYSVPCVISLLVAALYNIVDQIFIANAAYLGSDGNAANTVVFPLTVIALAIAVMIGDGCCAFVSISLGADRREDAHRGVGNAVVLSAAGGIVLCILYLIFSDEFIAMFGGTVNEKTFAFAKEYFFWIALGIPVYVFGQAMNPVIRSDGSPRFAMVSTVAGAVVNIILDPIFIFVFKWGMMGAGGCHGARPAAHGSDGGILSVPYALREARKRVVQALRRRDKKIHSAGHLQLFGADIPRRGDGGDE